jgi:hypothetical protein
MSIQRAFFLTIGAGILVGGHWLATPIFAHAATSPSDQTASSDDKGSTCFLRSQWTGGWKVTPDSRTIYIAVSNQIYQLDLSMAHPLLQSPFAILINVSRSDAICSPLDFDLTITDHMGSKEWALVQKLRRLTPAQAAALPKQLRP